MSVRCMIDEWESRVVSEHLALGRNGGKLNHYLMIKKHDKDVNGRFDKKMEWATDMAQSIQTSLNQNNEHLSNLEVNSNWWHNTILHNDDETAGGGNIENRGMGTQASLRDQYDITFIHIGG